MFDKPVVTPQDEKFMAWTIDAFRKLSPNLQAALISSGVCSSQVGSFRDVEMQAEYDAFVADSHTNGKEIYGK